MTPRAAVFTTFLALLSSGRAPVEAAMDMVLASGLKNPESVAVGDDGRVFVTVIGEFNTDGDGAVVALSGDKATPLATGLDDPKGIVAFRNALYVADKTRVWRIDPKTGDKEEFAPAGSFPKNPINLNDIAVELYKGALYVSDTGDKDPRGGAIFRIDPKDDHKVTLVVDQARWPELVRPNGLALDGESYLLVLDSGTGILHRVRISDGAAERVADGFGRADGVAWDAFGRLFASDWQGGRVFGIARPGEKPVQLAARFQTAADLVYDPVGRRLLVPDMKAGTVTAIAAEVPGFEVDETPLPLATEPAYAKLRWAGWQGPEETGKLKPLRPIVLTHAGDGTNRVFVATQQGVIHVFPNDQHAEATSIFLDIQERVRYEDKENEEGLLGVAFHPEYKKNGQFFVFYTRKTAERPNTNVVSRFRVRPDDSNRADPASEEELLRFERTTWNHDGGTLIFGPDRMLYICTGDGGLANDPNNHGQSLDKLHGKILRIDVDQQDAGKKYAVPSDNPFVNRPEARPEIWAYGLRNVWRMAFDRQTNVLWGADVGQNLYEEIDFIVKGGNYGWRIREGLHPFSGETPAPSAKLLEPIWEYRHDIGKSITGGAVYRGARLPELSGAYLYGDYVSGKIWGLWYDTAKGRVVANCPIADRGLPMLSWGEDETGELYMLTASPTGQGIFRLARKGVDTPAANP